MQSGSIAELPPHVLAVLLRYVPLADRVTNCSLVSTQFREAAAAATLCISTNLRADELGSFSFRTWLQRYGAHVTSLQLASTAMTDLPCQQLQQLKLSHCAVQLGTDSGQNALICSTQLTSLELETCVVAGGAQLPAVATLPNLQHLDLYLRETAPSAAPFHGVLSDSLLQELSQCSKLTFLGLSGAGMITSDASLQHLSAVTGLEALKLHWWGESSISAAGLSSLQYLQQLRSLDMETWYQGMDFVGIRAGSAPAFRYLTALTDLRLDGIYLEASVLLDTTQLCVLRLTDLCILDSDLLVVLSKLTCLQELVLEAVSLPSGSWPADVAAYCSLISSSNLRCLKLKELGGQDDSQGIPAAAWISILGPDLQHRLPLLRTLELPFCVAGFLRISHTASPGLAQLTSLQQLCLNRCTIESDVLSSLTQLTGLQLHGARVQLAADYDDVLLPTLAMLQQLQLLESWSGWGPIWCQAGQGLERGDLEVVELPAWPVRDVSAFTALISSSHLTHLAVYGCQLPAGAWQQALTAQQWQLPALVTCYLQTPCLPYTGPVGNGWQLPQLQKGYEPSAVLHQAGVAALARRCPSLQACSIGLQSGAQLSALSDLKRLTALTLRYQVSAAPEVSSDLLGGLYTVTSLRWLRLCSIEGSINKVHMLSLIALRRLTRIEFVDSDASFTLPQPRVRHHEDPAWREVLRLYCLDH